jgi:transposase InsO family protein
MGFPAQIIHSDQGRQFESEVFQQLCEMFEIRKTRTTTMHPKGNGQTERMNRTLLGLLKTMARDDPLDWDNKLPFVMMAYRSTPHSTTDETPNKLMLGREVTTPLTLLAPPPPDAEKKSVD